MQRGNEQEEEEPKGGTSNGDADPESLVVTVLVHTIRVADSQANPNCGHAKIPQCNHTAHCYT